MSVNRGDSVWLMRFGGDYQLGILESFLAEAGHSVSLVTCNPTDKERLERLLSASQSEILVNNDVCNLADKGFMPDRMPRLGFPDLSDPNFYYAIQVLDRFERFEGELSNYDRNHLLLQQYYFWTTKLNKLAPKAVVFMDIPHMYYELILLGLLKNHGIASFTLADVQGSGHVLLDSEMKPIQSSKARPFGEALSGRIKLAQEGRLSDYDLRFFSENRNRGIQPIDIAKAAAKWCLAGSSSYREGYYLKQAGFHKFGQNSARDEAKRELIFRAEAFSAKCRYRRISQVVRLSDLPSKFVYFPLPSGFENTLHPTCSPLDIAEIIRRLSSGLEDSSAALVIKEHPMQFRFRYHQRFARSQGFYEWLSSLTNVVVAAETVSHYGLIDRAESIACLSISSSLVEALARGKSVSYFGINIFSSESSRQGKISSASELRAKVVRSGSIVQGTTLDSCGIVRNLFLEIEAL